MTAKKMEKESATTDDLSIVKECFIITPIGSVGSEIHTKINGLIDSIIQPVLTELGYTALPAHRMKNAGSINKQIIQKIVNSEIVITNLTGLNANVMYELAIRHAFGKPVVTMAEKGTNLPFDIVDQRTIFYDDCFSGVLIAQQQLRDHINAILKNSDEKEQMVSNPIFDALSMVADLNRVPKEERDVMEVILSRLDSIENNTRKERIAEKKPDFQFYFSKGSKGRKQFNGSLKLAGQLTGDDLENVSNILNDNGVYAELVESGHETAKFLISMSEGFASQDIRKLVSVVLPNIKVLVYADNN